MYNYVVGNILYQERFFFGGGGDFNVLLMKLKQKKNCWLSHDVTKIQTTKLSILPRFYFHNVLEQLKSKFRTNFCLKRVLGFVIEYA